MSEGPFFFLEIDEVREREAVVWERVVHYRVVYGVDLARGADLMALVCGRMIREGARLPVVVVDHLETYGDEYVQRRLQQKQKMLDSLIAKIRDEDHVPRTHYRTEKKGRHLDNPRDEETKREWRRRLLHPHATARSR